MSQVYVITGTSRGIGLEYVKQLSEQDGNVIYAGARNPEGSEELMALVDNKKVFAFTIDVTSKESIEVSFAILYYMSHTYYQNRKQQQRYLKPQKALTC
jgi:NAD(P)-dependent dehydrogenase (short-subunit alcohol dehydrogenase family)